jgi:hypothetical protein
MTPTRTKKRARRIRTRRSLNVLFLFFFNDTATTEIYTPFEDLVELVGAEVVEFSRLGDAERASVTAIAVKDDSDVARCRPASDIADQPPGIEVIEQAEHRLQRSFPRSAGFQAYPPDPCRPRLNALRMWHADDQWMNPTCDQCAHGAGSRHSAISHTLPEDG